MIFIVFVHFTEKLSVSTTKLYWQLFSQMWTNTTKIKPWNYLLITYLRFIYILLIIIVYFKHIAKIDTEILLDLPSLHFHLPTDNDGVSMPRVLCDFVPILSPVPKLWFVYPFLIVLPHVGSEHLCRIHLIKHRKKKHFF